MILHDTEASIQFEESPFKAHKDQWTTGASQRCRWVQEATGTSDPRCPRMPLSTLACDETSGRPARPLLGAESPNLTGGGD